MVGEGVGGHDSMCGPCYAACIAACWPRLTIDPTLAALDPSTDTSLPLLRDFRIAYTALAADRRRLAKADEDARTDVEKTAAKPGGAHPRFPLEAYTGAFLHRAAGGL